MRKPVLSLLAALTLVWGGGCGKHRAGDRPLVGVTLRTEADGLGMQQAAESLGLDLRVVTAEADLARQTGQVDSFIDQRVDAIVIVPINPTGIVGAIEAANRARIPVFTADVASDGGTVVAHIASDHRQGGRLLGTYVAQRLGGGGNLVVLGPATLNNVRHRVARVPEALTHFPHIPLLASPPVDRGNRGLA